MIESTKRKIDLNTYFTNKKMTFMMKKLFLTMLCAILCVGLSVAQTRTITGVVISAEDGEPVIGASIQVKGTLTGNVTDVNGNFSLGVDADAKTLVVSYIGMETQEATIQPNMRIVLKSSSIMVDEIVVTALGISRAQKALGYATQKVKSEELVQAANSNLAGALQGKTSGIDIKSTSGMPGASSQITIRGARSFTGNNTPLYVIDGMPIASTPDLSTGGSVSGTDYSNRAVDIDPNDIETIDILKGQAASALYGIRASNGVIVITTKSGKGAVKGKPQISFNSSVSFDKINRYPELQTLYAQGDKGLYSPNSSLTWGPKISELPNDPAYGGNVKNSQTDRDGLHPGMYYVPQRANAGMDPWVTPGVYDNIRDYFDTGVTWNNFLNVSQALDRSSYSFSLGNTTQDGIMPSTGMDRYNAKLTAETKLTDHFKTGASASFVSTSIQKMPTANDGILATIYPAPPSYDLAGIPQNYEGNPYRINNYRAGAFPPAYWSKDNIDFNEKTNRFFGNAFAVFSTKMGTTNQRLDVKYQLGVDAYTTHYQTIWGYGIKGSANNGQIENQGITNTAFNSLATVAYDWQINDDWHFDALVGNEVVNNTEKYYYMYGGNFEIPGWNHIGNATVKDNSEEQWADRSVGFFANASVSYKSMVYLSVTGRQDYVSTMPSKNRSFFYPSTSLGFIVTELDGLKGNSIVNYAKLRVSYAQVGQAGQFRQTYYTTPSYGGGFYTFANPILYPINGVNAYVPSSTVYDPNLKPQNTQSYELGGDINFLNDLFTLNYTFSRQNVKDQIFPIPLAGSTGSGSLMSNGGSLHTNAHEVTLGINPIRTKNYDWNIAFNFTKIDNYVDKLAPEVNSIFLGGFVTPQVRAGIGDKYPVIYGSSYARDNEGRIIVDANGIPTTGPDKVIGSVSPDFLLGMNTSLRVHQFRLSAVFDWKSGGQMYGGTNGLLDMYGISKNTEGREGSFIVEGVKADGTPNTTPIEGAVAWQNYYSKINGIGESSIYNTSFIKLREIALSCDLYKSRAIEVGLNAFVRNILLWTEYPNLDPESSQSNGNMTGAFERFSLPQTTSYGMGVNLKF